MTTRDSSVENPHRISFSSEPLGIHTEVTIDSPVMDQLQPEERELLGKLIASESYTLALLMKAREDQLNPITWQRHILAMLDGLSESTSEIDAEINYKKVASLLGVDLSIPSFEPEIHEIPHSA